MRRVGTQDRARSRAVVTDRDDRPVLLAAAQVVGDQRRVRGRRGKRRDREDGIEDACQSAWTILLRRPDIDLDAGAIAWLRTVAAREAWALSARRRRELPAGASSPAPATPTSPAALPEPPADQPTVEEQVIARLEHQARRAAQAQRPSGAAAHGAGYAYSEIAELTDATYTAVNRRITEGRSTHRLINLPRHAPPRPWNRCA